MDRGDVTEEERRALAAIDFEWAATPDNVWERSPFHVDGLHGDAERTILRGVHDARFGDSSSPIGVVIQGQKGVGKTHLLGWSREQVYDNEGYFFLVGLLDERSFWQSTALAVVDGLYRRASSGETQLTAFLRKLAGLTGVPGPLQDSVAGDVPLSRKDLDVFIRALRTYDPQVGIKCADTARALVVYASPDDTMNIGHDYLSAMDEVKRGERAKWGIRQKVKPAQDIVSELSWLLSLAGPIVIAVDQIDTLASQYDDPRTGDQGNDPRTNRIFEQVAAGLMDLRQLTRRTLTLVSCIPASWAHIKNKTVDTVAHRFREATHLGAILDSALARALIERRVGAAFDEIGFSPPYATWPVRETAFEDARYYTVRELLMRVDAHVRSCLRDGEVRELDRLDSEPEAAAPATSGAAEPVSDRAMAELTARFNELKASANVSAALDPATEDAVMPGLLSAGLDSWIRELGDNGRDYRQDPPPSAKPTLHGQLHRSLSETTEDELVWAFRAIASTNPIAALNRLRATCTVVRLDAEVGKRTLIIIRNSRWSRGRVTRDVLDTLTKAGGRTVRVSEDDLRTFDALRQLLTERHPDLGTWLLANRPAGSTELFRAVLPEVPAAPVGIAAGRDEASSGEQVILIGETEDREVQVTVALESLRKHITIFAGSGSGKTVFIRRVIEECALQGISAIVLDPNNDLARLGRSWPEPPTAWRPGDADKARKYLADTDFVVWTPGRKAGRPLSFQPLPDFRSILDNADELNAAIDTAVAALAPRANVDGRTRNARLGQAVLREALRYFADHGEGTLRDFITVLDDLPDGVSELAKAHKIAGEMAQTLMAATVNDPLFGGAGEPADPGILLTPERGKKARISVISFVGLQSDEQRQSFVNQLQMSLFSWIKKNPAGDQPLGGLFVMDEAQTLAPASPMTACTHSTITLASQARKYGLGLVFATQAPKALHNRIPGNSVTQFFGFLNSPTQIAAAREMARAKGSDIPDISRLTRAQFYVAREGFGFEKIRTALCLSHHPPSPLSPEEVIALAADRRPTEPHDADPPELGAG